MINYNKQYIIIYHEYITTGETACGLNKQEYVEQIYETDDIDDFNSMLESVKDCCLNYAAIDTKNFKVLYNTITRNNNDKTYYDMVLLEKYFGDNKELYDFVDKKELDQYNQAINGNRYASPLYIWHAQTKYQKYLKNKWGKHNKVPKKLPKLQIYDDPHMLKEEIDALRQAEKERKDTIVNKCGW